jgi:IclR family transcriptional regulator, mhp operon transcriptional activator
MDVFMTGPTLDLPPEVREHKMPAGHPTPVRVLLRGLEIIQALNRHGPLSTAGLAQRLRLARTTINRCLATLEARGYVERDPVTRRFALTLQVRQLSQGFDAVAERMESVRRNLRAAASRLQWPASLMRFDWPDMRVEDSTDRSSGFAVEYFERGALLPVLTTASGKAFLAYTSAGAREAILDHLWPGRPEETKAFWADRAALDRELAAARERGFARAVRPLRLTEQGSIAVPVLVDNEPVAVVAVRFALSAVSFDDARKRLLPVLQEVARPAPLGVAAMVPTPVSGAASAAAGSGAAG